MPIYTLIDGTSNKAAVILPVISLLMLGVASVIYGQDDGEIVAGPPPEISGGAAMAGIGIDVQVEGMDRPLAPDIVVTPNAPVLSTSIEGINVNGNADNNSGSLAIPPDPSGAAGPNHVVSVVNTSIEWFTKAGVQQNSQSLASFFASLSPQTLTFDPKVIYDQHAGRFLVVTLEKRDFGVNNPANVSTIFLAVSDDNDPNGTWHRFAINAKIIIGVNDTWADYPGFAVDDEAVYITTNMFEFSGGALFGVATRLWIVHKGLGTGGFYDGGSLAGTVSDPSGAVGQDFRTAQPAHMFGTGPTNVGTFLVRYEFNNGTDEFLSIIRVDNPVTSPTFSHQMVNVGNIDDFSVAMPDAPQLGTSTDIKTNDRRALQAVWRDNALWATAQVVPPSGADAGEATAHWFKVDTSNLDSLTIQDQGNVGGEDIATGTHTFFPAIAVDSLGNMGIGFSASAPSIFPGAFYTGRLTSDAAGTVQPSATLRAGVDFYIRTIGGGSNRWGDYSGMSVDPSDDRTFWMFNEYALARGSPTAGGDGRWGTAFGSFTFGCIVPSSGDWTVTQDCTLTQNGTAPANVIVEANVTLTIAENITLNVDFLNFHVLVKDTGKLVIKSGAKVD